MNIQCWFPLELSGLIFLLSKGLSRVFSAPWFKILHQFFSIQLSLRSNSCMVQLYMTTGKTIALTIRTFLSKMMPLLFNMLSRFFIAFLPRSKHLLILCSSEIVLHKYSWLVFAKEAKAMQWVKDRFLNKQCWNNWTSTCKNINLDTDLITL